MAAYKIGLLSTYGMKRRRERITCKKLGQYIYCLINGILNTLVPLQSRGGQIKKIPLYQHLKLV